MMEMKGTGSRHTTDRTIKYGMKTASVVFNRVLEIVYTSPNLSDTLDSSAAKEQLTLALLDEEFPSVSLSEYVTKVNRGDKDVIEEEVTSVTGKYFLLSVCAFKLPNSYDTSNGVIVHFSDVSPLQISENKFRTLSDILPQLIWTNDEKGDANYFNARWYEYSGLTYEDSYGLGWQAMVHPDDAQDSISKWDRALATGNIFDTEYRLRDAAGKYRWYIGRNVPFKNVKGEVIGWYGTATDVQTLKYAESSLRESEERLRVTMESATDYAIITTDIDGVIRGWSLGAQRIFGYTAQEVIGVSADIIFTPEDRQIGAPDTEMRQAREFGRANDERWHLRKDGTTLFMSGVMSPIQGGILTGYVKVARDLTVRRSFEEKLLNSEERYRIALAAAEMIAWDYDILADKIMWNNETELVGSDKTENRLSLFMSFVYEKDKKYVEEKMFQALENTGTFQAEFRIYTPEGGDLKWMNCYGKALINDKKEAYRLVGVMYDITKRKMLEAQKEDFIGIASHELKTPVTSIKAYAEILEEIIAEKNDAVTANLVSKLGTQVDRLNDLIKELLDTTKISEGQLQLKRKFFDLNSLISNRVEELQLISQKHQLHTEYCYDGMIAADPDLIAQAITNLISNAIKYSPKGGDIFIKTIRQADSIKVTVRDFGIGVPESDREKIFQRFFRVTLPSVQTFPGMGLGLYITAGIIHQHDGTISVESEPEKGSTFSFVLPQGEHFKGPESPSIT